MLRAAARRSTATEQLSEPGELRPTAAHVAAHCISALLLTVPPHSQVLQGSSPIQHRQQTPRATPLVRVCARCSCCCNVHSSYQSHVNRCWPGWSMAGPSLAPVADQICARSAHGDSLVTTAAVVFTTR